MSDPKKLTLRYLRELARKHIGRGHSKLKTKAELLLALKAWLSPTTQRQAQPLPKREKRGAHPASARNESAPAKVMTFLRGQRGKETEEKRNDRVSQGSASLTTPPVSQHVAQPLIEGFFLARVAGEGEVRRHHLTEASVLPSSSERGDDHVRELFAVDADDTLHVLARDPRTLFVFWDFQTSTRDRAARGLKSPRAVLRIFEGEDLVREIDFVPEARSFYVHHLSPGRRYRAEAYFVGKEGQSRRIGHPSEDVELPGTGASDGDVRFMQLRSQVDLRRLKNEIAEGTVQVRVLDAGRARTLGRGLQSQGVVRPSDASSDRRGLLFSPSGQP